MTKEIKVTVAARSQFCLELGLLELGLLGDAEEWGVDAVVVVGDVCGGSYYLAKLSQWKTFQKI